MTLRFKTEDEFSTWDRERKHRTAGPPAKSVTADVIVSPAPAPKPEMNDTERRWSERLEIAKREGRIRDWFFGRIKLKLADRTWYMPDFLVQHADGRIELQEIKGGYIREDGWLKFKMARDRFPAFIWSLWQWKEKQWRKVQ